MLAGLISPTFAADAQPGAAAKLAPQKSIADVLDKVVDKASDVVGAIADAMKKAGPEVWRIMVIQQYAKAITAMIPSIGFIVVMLILRKAAEKYKTRLVAENNGKVPERWIDCQAWPTLYGWAGAGHFAAGILACVSGLFLAYALTDAILYLVNPEYYAIKDIFQIILSRGQLQ